MFPATTISGIVTFIIILLIAIAVHETMHAFVAHKLGDSTAHDQGRISLNPLAHVDLLTTVILPVITLILFQSPILAAKPVMVDVRNLRFGDYGWALVSIAGPLSNLVMAIIAAAIINAGFIPGVLLPAALWFVGLNIGMFVFNMIPIPPLDGSRVLRAFAPQPLQELMDRFEGFGFGFSLLIIFVLLQFISPLVSSISEQIWRILF